MAVYTPVSADDLTAFLAGYDVGAAVSFKGIAEGVENSNFLLETTRGRFILTLYEKRVDAGDLPWFLALMGHLAAKGLPVPGPVVDARGQVLQVAGGDVERPGAGAERPPGLPDRIPAGCERY